MREYSIDAKLVTTILYLVTYALLWFGYSSFVVPIFGYMGFEWTPNIVKLVESFIAIFSISFSLPSRVKHPSDFLIHVHFLIPIVPMLVLYAAADLPRVYMYFVIIAFIVVCLVRKLKFPKIKGDMFPMRIMIWGLLIISAICIFSIISQGGLKYFNINLLNVYEFRKSAAEGLHPIYGYFSPMVSRILLPFILLLAVYYRKWLIAGLAISGSFMMFALTNHKGPLFYPFLVLGGYYVMSRQRKKMVPILLICYLLVVLVSLAGFFAGGFGTIIGSLSLRRALFTPANLNFVYYDFFSTHAYTMLAQSKLTLGLITYPYNNDSAHLIGSYYFNNELAGANTGWLGTGFMHFGFLGMIIYAVLIGLLLSLVDTLAKGRNLGVSGAISFIPFIFLFSSSDLPTAMLTHGLLLSLFLTWSCSLRGQLISNPVRTTAAKQYFLPNDAKV